MNGFRIYAFVLLCLILASGPTALGQAKYDKAYQKAEAKYATGEYKEALKLLEDFKNKTERKFGKDNRYTNQYLLARARYSLATGMLNDFDVYLNQALRYTAATNPQTSEPFAVGLIDAAELYNQGGNARRSRELLDEATKVLKANGSLRPELRARIDINMAEVLTQQGYFREALALLKRDASLFRNRTGKVETYTDDSGQEKTRKLDEKQLAVRNAEYARWMTSLGHAYARQGNGNSADSAFVAAGTWIQRNLDESSEAYVRNQILFSDKLVDNGLQATGTFPKHSGYEAAISNIRKKHVGSHVLGMEALLRQLKWLMYKGDVSGFNKLIDEYEKLTSDFFPKETLYIVRGKALFYDLRMVGKVTSNLGSEATVLISSNTNLPRHHPLVADINQFLYDLAIYQRNFRGAPEYLRRNIEIRESILGKDAPETHLARLKLANHLLDYSNAVQEALSIYKISYDSIVSRQIGSWQRDHLDILNHLATLYEYTDQYGKADASLAKALDVAESKFGRSDGLFGVELTQVASLRLKMGQYIKAEKELKEALTILGNLKKETEWKVPYINTLQTEARFMGLRGMFSEAEENLDQAAYILKKSKDENLIIDQQAAARELSSLYILLGRYAETELLLDNLISDYERSFGGNSARLIEPLVNRGYLQLAKGDYTAAEKTAQRAYDISVKVYTERSTKTAAVQRLLSDIYFTLGDYVKAEEMISKSIESQQNQFGRNHLEVAKSLSQLGVIRYSRGDTPQSVEKPLNEARSIIAEQLGTDNPPYAEVLKNTAILYIAGKKYPDALSSLSQAEHIWSTKTGSKNNIRAAAIYVLTGDVYYQMKSYNRSEEFYNRGKKIFEDNFSKTHPEYVKILSKLSRIYFMAGDYKKSKRNIEEALSNYENYIKQYFPALSEREKAKYWNTIKTDFEFYYTLAFSQADEFKDLTGKVYNYQLLTKALLLNSSLKIRERILSSTNAELKNTYNLWVQKKELLTKALSMNSTQLAEQEIDPSLVATEAERLEKELSEKSELFGQSLDNKKVTFENVQKSLNKNDVAVEIVRYRHFNHTFTDSVVYVALLLKPDQSKPEIVRFPRGAQMETRYFRYYSNSMRDETRDRYSYDIYWKPVQSHISIQTVNIYLSPDGIFNQINLESIPLPDRDDAYIIDKTNIVLVNNTRDLYLRKVQSKASALSNSATMIGNPVFYTRNDVDRAFPDLPGTEGEIQEVKGLLVEKGWQTNGFTASEATEEQIKAVDNPKILHIATHGFYAPTVERNLSDEMTATDNNLSDNPLLKSGLLLKGGGDIISRSDRNYNAESGILTAYEAMSLNLDNTDLVVLSACETGRGEVATGEGVYGLQRAFLIAGAKVLIMSIFQVDDEATQRLIINFYDKWLATGNLRQSFKNAKLDLRKEFPEPIYWGSFMMVGLD